jgi:hypothetical protein
MCFVADIQAIGSKIQALTGLTVRELPRREILLEAASAWPRSRHAPALAEDAPTSLIIDLSRTTARRRST